MPKRAEDMRWNLEPLLNPRSVAIVGASETSFYGSMLYQNLVAYGFKGNIYPINPKYDSLFGVTCYASLAALPEPPDQVAIIVRREMVLDQVKSAIAAGAKSATIVSAGFGETDEDEWKQVEADIRQLSIDHQFPILGPNCLGAINVHGGVGALAAPIRGGILPGNIALIMQSGGLLQGLVYPFYQRGIGLSYAVSSGNNMSLDMADFIEHGLKDPNTDVICVYMEGFKQPEKFKRVAKQALEAGKPIVVLKVGKSEKAAKATFAHTGSLAGSDHVIDAVFEQYGVVRVSDFEELLETAAVLSVKKEVELPEHSGIGMLGGSGGAVGLTSDLAAELGIHLPELAPETREELIRILPPSAIVLNPVDATGQILNDFDTFRKTVDIMSKDPNIGVILYAMTLGMASTDIPRHQKLLDIIMEVAGNIEKPLVIFSLNSHSLDEWQTNFLRTHKQIAFTQGLRRSLQAVQRMIDYNKRYHANKRNPRPEPIQDESRRSGAVQYVQSLGRKVLTEYESKRLLNMYGIPTSRERLAATADEAAAAAEEIGYPLVMKIVSPDILHKTEAGGVRVGIQNREQLLAAYGEMMSRAAAYKPDADIHGVLIQELVAGGTEMIIGASRDEQFGTSIMVGMGGIFVEVLKDSVFKMPPLTEDDAMQMIRGSKGYPVLAGARGKGPKDIAALQETLLKISQLVIELEDYIEEMDMNPLLVMDEGEGVKAVDALFVLR